MKASRSSWWTLAPSAVSYRTNRRPRPPGPPISGADGKDIPCWGHIPCRLTFRLRTFFVTFLLAAVYRPILGLDFLSAHGLLVDPVGRQVLDSKSLKPLSKPTTATGGPRSCRPLCPRGRQVFTSLLQDIIYIFQEQV
jgi:hypothetical protein